MPKRTDIESVLIIGAGAIAIGQACEFDYSGMQALREEGCRGIPVASEEVIRRPLFRSFIEMMHARA